MNNMACGVLTVGGTPQIYCVGGSAGGGTTAAARVFSYNPVTDTITPLTAADNWPGNTAGTILPGGFAVVANKLYIIGGFNIGTGRTAQTWQFDPTAAVGSRWLQRLDYPWREVLYSHGRHRRVDLHRRGSDIALHCRDGLHRPFTANDPVANTWTAIANIPRATGETRAVVINNQMWVLGGGRTAPNPSNEVDIYNPDQHVEYRPSLRHRPAQLPSRQRRLSYLAGGRLRYIWNYPAQHDGLYGPGACASPTPGTPDPTATATTTAYCHSNSTPRPHQPPPRL